jgi:hypothetical protein
MSIVHDCLGDLVQANPSIGLRIDQPPPFRILIKIVPCARNKNRKLFSHELKPGVPMPLLGWIFQHIRQSIEFRNNFPMLDVILLMKLSLDLEQ